MKNADRPMNPIVQDEYIGQGERILQCTQAGLTKREYFAGLAMQGLCAAPDKGTFSSFEEFYAKMGLHAVKIADELLKELETQLD